MMEIEEQKFSKSAMKRNLSVGTTVNSSSTSKISCLSTFNRVRQNYSLDLSRNLNSFIKGKLNRSEYLSMQKEAISTSFKNAYLLGKLYSQNTENGLTDYENRMLSSLVSSECRFMEKFADDVLSGGGKMPYNRRLKMYSDGLVSLFMFGNIAYLAEDSHIYWILGSTDKHCPSCLSLAHNSPYTKRTLPTIPKSGYTECLCNCKCILRYDNTSEYLDFVLNNFNSVNGRKNVPQDYEYDSINTWIEQYYYYKGEYVHTRDPKYNRFANNVKDIMQNYIKFNELAISVKLPVSTYISEFNTFMKSNNFEYLTDYSVLKHGDIVSIFHKNEQIYAKVDYYSAGNVVCMTLTGERITLNQDTMHVFVDRSNIDER